MSITFDQAYLASLGLQELGEEVGQLFLSHVRATLELRTGQRVSACLDEPQLDEFDALFQAGDQAGAHAWLERNCPSHKAIVEQEFAALTKEIRSLVPLILSVEAQLMAVPA